MELKPCPFCGGEAKTEVGYIKCGGDELLLRATIYCEVCGTSKSVKFNAELKSFGEFADNFNAAAEAWNRRANDV